MKIKNDLNYSEGLWAGDKMIANIDNTIYGSLEQAIKTKQELVDNFEEKFGYAREMKEFDPNYSFNCGILDSLKKELKNQTI